MLEEWKNFVLYKQWCKDEDVEYWPFFVLLILGLVLLFLL